MLISVTRLRVRSFCYLAAFMWHTIRSQKQLARAAGFREGKVLADAHRTFWTMTAWESEREMKAFRGSAAHAKAMPHLAQWCDEGAYVHWAEEEEDALPSWAVACERFMAEAKMSRVEHPSADHQARRFAPPRLSPQIGGAVRPARSLGRV
jgi:hypothetical protein